MAYTVNDFARFSSEFAGIFFKVSFFVKLFSPLFAGILPQFMAFKNGGGGGGGGEHSAAFSQKFRITALLWESRDNLPRCRSQYLSTLFFLVFNFFSQS